MSRTPVVNALPSYSPPIPAPDYSFEPSSGERTLQSTPRIVRPIPEGTFVHRAGKTTVVLLNQEANLTTPSYGRAALVAGSILFDSREQRIAQVVLKVQGRLETMSSEAGSHTATLVDERYTLWSHESREQCPNQVSFSVRLPATFNDGGEQRMLPPSYDVAFPGAPGMFVRSKYAIQILITRTRSRKVGFFTKTKRISMPFNYNPRTRPHRPIVPSPCFFSSVKGTPEEWYQTVAALKTAPLSAGLDQIYSHLFIPASRIYGIRDTIPLHVQLTGPASSLRAFLQPKSQESARRKRPGTADSARTDISTSSSFFRTARRMNRLSNSFSNPFKSITRVTSMGIPDDLPPSSPQQLLTLPQASDPMRPTLRAFLLRQVTIETRGEKSWRNQIIGEARLSPVPPPLSMTRYSPHSAAYFEEEDHLDWEGELKVDEEFCVGGWQAASVHVKDFIALAVMPQSQKTSHLHGLQVTVPVKLVTDPWSDSAPGLGQLTPDV